MQILKKEMKLKGIEFAELVELINKEGWIITESAVNAWMSGRSNPKAKAVKRLSELGFSDTACLNPSKDVEV